MCEMCLSKLSRQALHRYEFSEVSGVETCGQFIDAVPNFCLIQALWFLVGVPSLASPLSLLQLFPLNPPYRFTFPVVPFSFPHSLPSLCLHRVQ